MSAPTVTDIVIENVCYESLPCQHYATVTYSSGLQTREMFSGTDIVDMLSQLGRVISSHFRQYVYQ
jgi:hypothetical protein